jgi:hypothetical protein
MAATGERAFAVRLDPTSFVTKCASQEEARSLPSGAVVGDRNGGLTFTDVVASVLESRSHSGWLEVETSTGDRWTIIVLNRN